jgi:hypothetical protein
MRQSKDKKLQPQPNIFNSSKSFKKIPSYNDKDAMDKNIEYHHNAPHHDDHDDTQRNQETELNVQKNEGYELETVNLFSSDPKEYNKIINNPCFIKTLFPWKKNVDFQKLQMTKVGKYSISNRYDSTQLSKLIRKILYHFKKKPKQTTITDATASIGGNTISFSMFLGHVNAIELDTLTYNALCHNVDQYHLKNISLLNQNCLDIIYNLPQDIVFFDPPWGGKKYKEHTEIDLYLDDKDGTPIDLVEITNTLFDKNLFDKNLFLSIIKIPKNFAITKFVKLSKYTYFYLMICKKYNILFLCTDECTTLDDCENITRLIRDIDCNIIITPISVFVVSNDFGSDDDALQDNAATLDINNMGLIKNTKSD